MSAESAGTEYWRKIMKEYSATVHFFELMPRKRELVVQQKSVSGATQEQMIPCKKDSKSAHTCEP